MSDLIRDYNNKQQQKYASNLEMPKVVAPALQDAAPVKDEQLQVTTPQNQQNLQQMTAPPSIEELGLMSNMDATAEFNARLGRQLPTLLGGQPTDAERRSNEYYNWVDNQIEENRKRYAAQSIALPSLQQYNTPTQQRPNGFGSNVLKAIFGAPGNTSDDNIMGNEFDVSKGRFGQYGGGFLGGAMYLLDNTLGLGIVRNTLMDTAANLTSQASGWVSRGGVFDTLFKSRDVGQALIAGSNRQKQSLRNIYGDSMTSFTKQGLLGRDLGALGNLSGDAADDYKKMYGSSPVAAGLDRAFFGRPLTEQESKDYEKLTGYAVKEAANLPFKPEETQEYNEILGRVPEDFKTKMLLRNITGLVSDVRADDFLKPLIGFKPPTPKVDVVNPSLPQLSGAPEPLKLQGASPSQRLLPPKERNTAASDEYIGNWLRRGESVETKPVGVAGELSGRGIDPWVTIDATAVRIPEALPSRNSASLPPARSPLPKTRTLTTPGILPSSGTTRSALPSQEIVDDISRSLRESVNNPLSVTDAITKELRASTAKSLVVSPPLAQVVTPRQADAASVLRQQYMRRVEPGQYIVQRLGTIADTDPLIALKSIEPAPQVANPVKLSPLQKSPMEIADTAKSNAAESDSVAQFRQEDELVQQQIQREVLTPKSEVSKTSRSPLPKNPEISAKDEVAPKDIVTTPKEPEAPPEVQEVKAKLIPSSKEEILRKARERLEANKKAERGEVVEPIKEEATTNESVVKNEVVQGESPKAALLRQAREKLEAEKAARRLESAVAEGFAKPVEGGAEVRVDVETPKGQELLNEAIDFDNMFNKTYAIEDLDTMISMVSRAASGAPISFVGKVAPIGEVARSQKEVYRFASLVPHPTKPGKPLLAPTKSMVAEYASKYGVEHPFASQAIADSSMKYLTKNGGARRHKSLADLAQEQTNPLYRKILSPTGTPIPLAVIEKFEKQMAEMGGQALVKTSSDTVSAIDAAPVQVDAKSQPVVKRSRFEAQKFIDDNKLGIKKNLSAPKLNELLDLYESKGIEALPDDAFTKAALATRKAATSEAPVATPKREAKVEAAAKKVTKSETLEEFEDAVVKLEDLEPTLKELEAIEKKVSNLPIFDHRKKLASPSHTPEVVREAAKVPEVAQKQEDFSNLVNQIEEVVVQEQELFKTKQAIDVAIDNVDAQVQARVSKLMDKYGLPRAEAAEFDESLQAMLARNGEAFPLVDEKGWTRSRKAAFKDLAQSLLDVDDMKTSSTYEQWRQDVIDSGEYEKAAAWLYQNSGTKKATNPVISIDADGNFDFMSGSSTFFAAMDSGLEQIPVQIVFDARLGSKAIEWTKHPLAKGERTKVSVADLDSRWKTDRVEAGGEGGIGTRYESAREFMKANDKINMSEVVVKPDGSVVFKDGRHRFAVLRDEGVGVISVMAENPQYLSPENIKAPSAPTVIDVVKQLDEIPQEVKQQPATNTKPDAELETATLADALKWTTTKQGATNPLDVASVLNSVDVFKTPVTLKQLKNDVSGYDVPSVKPWYSQKRQERLQLNVYPLEALKETYANPLVKAVVDSYKRDGAEAAVRAYIDVKTTNPKTGKKKPFNSEGVAADEEYIPKEQLQDVIHELGGILRLIPYLEGASALKKGAIEAPSTLSSAQAEAVRRYTEIAKSNQGRENYYRGINEYLRTGEPLPGFTQSDLNATIADLDAALEALPKHKGDVVRIVSPSTLPSDLKPGAVLRDKGYLSTIPKEAYDEGREVWSPIGGSRGRVEIRIKNANGALLEGYSEHGMIEALLGRNTAIEVTKVERVGGVPKVVEGVVKTETSNNVLVDTPLQLEARNTPQPPPIKQLWEKVVRGRKGENEVEPILAKMVAPKVESLTVSNMQTRQAVFQKEFLQNDSLDTPDSRRINERLARAIDDSLLDILKNESLTDAVVESLVDGENYLSRNTLNFLSDLEKPNQIATLVYDTAFDLGRIAWNKATPKQRVYLLKEAGYDVITKLGVELSPEKSTTSFVQRMQNDWKAFAESTNLVEGEKLLKTQPTIDEALASKPMPKTFSDIAKFLNETNPTPIVENVSTGSAARDKGKGIKTRLLPPFHFKAADRAHPRVHTLLLKTNDADVRRNSNSIVLSNYAGDLSYRYINAFLRNGWDGAVEMLKTQTLVSKSGKVVKERTLTEDEARMAIEQLVAMVGATPKTIEAIANSEQYHPFKRRDYLLSKYGEAKFSPEELEELNQPRFPIRGLPLRFVENLKVGDELIDRAIISTSTIQDHAVSFAKGEVGQTGLSEPGALVRFKTVENARVTANVMEGEVIYLPNTKFKVVAKTELEGLPLYEFEEITSLDELALPLESAISADPLSKIDANIQREPLSRQNIDDAVSLADKEFDAATLVGRGLNPAISLPPLKVSRSAPLTPGTIGQAVNNFKDALRKVNKTGELDADTQIALNNSVLALETLKDKTYANKMREVVARLSGRGVNEGKPFMSAAVEMLNDNKPRSRDEIADILSYAIGTKDVKFATNLTDEEVLKFGRLIAQRPETFSQFDHLYVGHGTGVVEHGTWSLEARPSAGYKTRELVQHVVDNLYPKGSEVGVAACETGCPKRIQDAVPPLHRVVSRGAVASSLENMQRLIEGLSDMPTTPKVMDVLAEYDGLLREAITANKQRGAEILEQMQTLEADFDNITRRSKFANEQRTRAQIKKAQSAIEKDLLGDC